MIGCVSYINKCVKSPCAKNIFFSHLPSFRLSSKYVWVCCRCRRHQFNFSFIFCSFSSLCVRFLILFFCFFCLFLLCRFIYSILFFVRVVFVIKSLILYSSKEMKNTQKAHSTLYDVHIRTHHTYSFCFSIHKV